ncbi:MAG: hypothetical protein J7M10_00505 [Candidatus Cloacimonetes bacterium]|nr:hypothetical protein [Candidatus Cloacimonadota bacterium]
MKKLLLLLTICFISLQATYALDESNLSEAEIQIEAQKDLAAILQYSVKYRFSPDLKVGDKIEYKRIKDPFEETDISIEVTKEDKDGVWIVEKFDDMEIHMLVDLENMELIDFFGYDEGDLIPNPPLVTENEMIKRIKALNKFKNGLAIFGIPQDWEDNNTRETMSTKSGTFECMVLEPAFPEEVKEKAQDEKMVKELCERMKLYFSAEIPKLIPFDIAKYAIGSSEVFEKIPGGLVKNDVIEIKDFKKK